MSTLAIRQLQFSRGARPVLREIDLTLAAGCVTAILGPNGAGKSTLLGCLAGLLSPGSGTIEIDDARIETLPGKERARRIAFLPQTATVAWPIDVQTLVGLGRIPYAGIVPDEQNRLAVQHAMDITRVSQWAGRIVNELSGGERARVLLARVLAGTSKWILADEPFTGLDPAHQLEAADLLRQFAANGGGVVLTVHDLSLAARIADRIVLLNDGRVVADGPPAEALDASNLRAVYGVETEWLVSHAHRTPFIAIHRRHAG
jgi:iron complex transport system ATP-binding protein